MKFGIIQLQSAFLRRTAAAPPSARASTIPVSREKQIYRSTAALTRCRTGNRKDQFRWPWPFPPASTQWRWKEGQQDILKHRDGIGDQNEQATLPDPLGNFQVVLRPILNFSIIVHSPVS